MLFFLLSAVLGGALASSMLGSSVSDDQEGDVEGEEDTSDSGAGQSDQPAEDGQDDVYETTVVDQRGEFVGSNSDDIVNVKANIPDDMSSLWDGYEEQDIPLDVRGGEGDDLLLLSGGGYVVRGDQGADRIELGDASRVAVYAGQDDTVVGGTGADVFVHLSENAVFEGGAGNDLVHSTSTASLSLGAGNDTFFGLNGARNDDLFPESVSGDAGDDFLHGGIDQQHLWWAHANDQGNISLDADTLDGGDGNDTLLGSHADVLTGGNGADEFIVVLNRDSQSPAARVTDFVPGQDALEIRYGEDAGGFPDPDFFQRIDHTHFTVTEVDGSTIISNSDGQDLVLVERQIGLTIGIEQWNEDSLAFELVDPSGAPIDAADCSIIIMQQWQ